MMVAKKFIETLKIRLKVGFDKNKKSWQKEDWHKVYLA